MRNGITFEAGKDNSELKVIGNYYKYTRLTISESLPYISSKFCPNYCLGGLGLIIASPVMMAIAILLLGELPEPIFWISQRVGKDGRIFDFYNFRTMKVDNNNQKYLTTVARFIRN